MKRFCHTLCGNLLKTLLELFGVILIVGVGACKRNPPTDRDRLTLFVASSVAEVIRHIADRFEERHGVHVTISQGASGRLYKQIQLGAPCDIFIPADPAYLDPLQREGLILATSRSILAGNQLVVVIGGKNMAPWADIAPMGDPSLGSIILASPDHAPAGRYAMEALEHAGLWRKLKPRILNADNVRLAARYVAEGGVKIGLVYATDALAFADELSIVYRFTGSALRPINYEAAVIKTSSHRSASLAFIEFTRSAEAIKIWRRYGFTPPQHKTTSSARQ